LLYAPVTTDASRRAVRCDCLAHRYGNAADRPERRPVYPTNLTNGQWAAIFGPIPVPARIGGRGNELTVQERAGAPDVVLVVHVRVDQSGHRIVRNLPDGGFDEVEQRSRGVEQHDPVARGDEHALVIAIGDHVNARGGLVQGVRVRRHSANPLRDARFMHAAS
jgi:hypothetical protein